MNIVPHRERFVPITPLPRCLIREMVPTDRGFVFKNFIRAGYNGYGLRNMPRAAFEHFGALLCEMLVDRSQTLVVCRKDNHDELLAFSIGERPFADINQILLHYVYIKAEFREQGLCTALIATMGHDTDKTTLFATHMNPCWQNVGKRYRSIYNPFFVHREFQLNKEPGPNED